MNFFQSGYNEKGADTKTHQPYQRPETKTQNPESKIQNIGNSSNG